MRILYTTIIAVSALALVGTAAAQAPRDHVLCYKVKQSKGFEAFGKTDATKKTYARIGDIIDVNNQQGLLPADVPGVDFTYQVKKVKDVCVPADKNAEGINDPETHWVMYQIKQQKGACDGDPAVPCKKDTDCIDAGAGSLCEVFKELAIPKFDKKDPTNLAVRVKDQFTDLRVDFAKEAMLLAPSSLDDGSFQGVPAGEERYKCYAVKPTKKACASDAPVNPLGFCKGEEDCGGAKKVTEHCQKQPKFPKETHPNGLSASIEDSFQAGQDPLDPPKTFDLKKLKMFCQAAETKRVGVASAAVVEPQAGLLCYQAKLAGGKCAADSPANALGSCKAEEQCGGEKKVTAFCQKKADPKFDKKDPSTLARYAEDEYFQHRLDVAKEDLFCIPACRGYEENFEFTELVAHVTSIGFAPTNVGVNVDGLPTCSPGGCNPALGIDNRLGSPPLNGLLNPLLAEQIDLGSINLLFQASELANGEVTISGFLGELDASPGCSAGDEENPPVDPGNPGDPCNYVVTGGITAATATSCNQEALISIDVTVAGAESAPSATAIGGGAGNNFTLDLPFGDQSFVVTAENVLVNATITHDGSDIAEINGVLGGAVFHADLVAAIRSLPSSCFNGTNDGTACTTSGDCTGGGACQVGETIPFTSDGLADFIQFGLPPDLDLGPEGNCQGGANSGEVCVVVADCPDSDPGTSCEPEESISLSLQFEATEAIITGVP